MRKKNLYASIGTLFRQISHPTRIKILLEIGNNEVCVCHLEAQLGLRQAYLSQHLMALRDMNLLTTERDGRYIFYRLADPAILDLIREAAAIMEIEMGDYLISGHETKACSCPNCSKT
jgi:ArsR family transcriptional regulator